MYPEPHFRCCAVNRAGCVNNGFGIFPTNQGRILAVNEQLICGLLYTNDSDGSAPFRGVNAQ